MVALKHLVFYNKFIISLNISTHKLWPVLATKSYHQMRLLENSPFIPLSIGEGVCRKCENSRCPQQTLNKLTFFDKNFLFYNINIFLCPIKFHETQEKSLLRKVFTKFTENMKTEICNFCCTSSNLVLTFYDIHMHIFVSKTFVLTFEYDKISLSYKQINNN